MGNYNYIPLPELRRQYQYRTSLKRLLAELAIELVFAAVYGMFWGLMIMGLWIRF